MADRSVTVRLLANVAQFKTAMRDAEGSTNRTTEALKRQDTQMVRQEKTIDRFSGRLRLFAEAGTVLGPSIIPISAAATQALMGVSAGFLAVGSAAGVALLALHGIGDGLKALDKFQLDPTAENLKAVREEFDKLGPSGEHFVRYLDQLEPQLKSLQNTARAGFLPGVEQGIDNLLTKAPQVRQILANISREMGSLTADGGEALAGPRFQEFFDYLETDAAPTLRDFTVSLGNVVEGVGHLIVAFAPMSSDFSQGLVEMTDDFATWSAELSKTEGFKSFTDYIDQNGPAVLDFIGSLSMALVDIASAAAPFGQTLLPILTDVFQLLSTIAGSPIGPTLFTAAAGFVALNRATRILGPGMGNLSEAFLDLRTSPNKAATAVQRFGGAARIAAGAAGMGLLLTSLNETDKGLRAFEASAGGALAGFAVAGPWGAAVGGAIGLLVSLGTANDDTAKQVDDLAASFDQQTGAITENTRAKQVQALQDKGLLDSAQFLGISVKTLTDATMGNAKAQERLNAALGDRAINDVVDPLEKLSAGASEAEKHAAELDQAAFNLRQGVPGLAENFSDAAAQADQFATAMGGTANKSDAVSSSIQRQNDRIRANRAAAREAARQWVSLGEDLDNAKVSLQGWLRELEKQADALAAFGANAARAARRGLDEGLIKSLEKAGPAGALRMKQLADASDKEIRRANRAWNDLTNGVQRYVNQRVPDKIIRVQADEAFDTITAVKYALAQLHNKTLTVTVLRNITALNKIAGMGAADGATVPKTGMGYADRHPYMLADGEEVVSDRFGGATKNRGSLKAASRGAKLAVVGGMAAGGTAGHGAKGHTVPAFTAYDGPMSADTFAGTKGLNIAMSVKALLELDKAIKSLHKSIRDSTRAIAKETKHRDQLSAIVDANRAELERLQGLYDSLAGAIKQGLQQDIFAKVAMPANTNKPWSSDAPNGGSDATERDATFEEILARVQEDTAKAGAFSAAETTLSKFLSGGALESVIGSGDLGRAQMFANLTPEQLSAYQAAFGGRELGTGFAGMIGAESEYGADIGKQTEILSASVERLDQSNHELNLMNKQLKVLERSLDRSENVEEKIRDHLQELRKEARERHQEAMEKKAREKKAREAGAMSRK